MNRFQNLAGFKNGSWKKLPTARFSPYILSLFFQTPIGFERASDNKNKGSPLFF
jgi:hypothetical protein